VDAVAIQRQRDISLAFARCLPNRLPRRFAVAADEFLTAIDHHLRVYIDRSFIACAYACCRPVNVGSEKRSVHPSRFQ
jgi:hypothetical protein